VEAGGLGERVFVAVSAEGHAPALEPVILRGDGPLDTVVRLARAEPWTGRVLDARGAPVEGARVWTTDDGISGPTPPVETGADGAFRVPPPHPPAPGRRVLLVAEKGGARAALALRPGMLPPRPLVLTLAGGTRVSGRVQDRRGADLAGVIVRLVPSWGDVPRGFHPDADTSRLLLANERGFPGLSTATGAGGAWSVGDVPPGPWVLVFEHDGVRQRRPEVLQVGTRPLAAGTEVLDEGRSIVGDVVDARGDPVPGAAVDVRADGEGRALRRARSGTDGHFAVEGLAPGRYLVTAVVSGRPPARAVADLEREDVVSVGLALEEPAALRVRVTRAGAPWDGVLTLAFADARGGRGTARRVTERVQHGVLALDDAPTGLWTVQGFAAGGLRAQARQVALDAGRETGCELDLAPAARLAGVVRSADGSPAAAARVTLVDAAGDVRLPATSAADGSFSFEDLAPGSWTLEAYGRGGAPARRDVQVASGPAQAVELRLAPAGTLHVRVRDEAGRPVAEARLAFLAADGLVRTLTPARTGRDGMASQGDLPEGGLRVRAQAPDGRSGEAEAEVQAGRTVEVDVRLGAAER
jgi:protocatechuate 3,4-dioxygenase beta subunit